MNRLLKFLWIVVCNDFVSSVKEISNSVSFENSAEIPSVAMVVGELRIFQLRIDLVPHLFEEFQVGPVSPRSRPFRIAVIHAPDLRISWILLFFRPHRR